MRLETELYTIISSAQTESGSAFLVRLLPGSVIYKAHFPGHPVTPGACLVEMAHELLETCLKCPLDVRTIKNVKFLSVISPLEVQEVTFLVSDFREMEGSCFQSQITVFDPETVYAKISLICQKR